MISGLLTLLFSKLNGYLDKLACPCFYIWGKSLSAYKVCGYVGLIIAVLFSIILTLYSRLPLLPMLMIVTTAVITFFALVFFTKIVAGEEQLTYYHQEFAILAVSAALLKFFRQPVLPYLDITILGLGIFLAFGRMGCFRVGCCHGRPFNFGVVYSKEHCEKGFPESFANVRLFPIQLVESMWVLAVVLHGATLVLKGRASGEALAVYVVAYGIGRFCFEFIRGDTYRTYFEGFSEGQWTSLILMSLVAAAELSDVIPLRLWHIISWGSLVVAMIASCMVRHIRKAPRRSFLQPKHIKEVADAIAFVSNLAKRNSLKTKGNFINCPVCIVQTSLGVLISASRLSDTAGWVDQYTLSCKNLTMTKDSAITLVRLILRLQHPSRSCYDLVEGKKGFFHLIVYHEICESPI